MKFFSFSPKNFDIFNTLVSSTFIGINLGILVRSLSQKYKWIDYSKRNGPLTFILRSVPPRLFNQTIKQSIDECLYGLLCCTSVCVYAR